MAQAQAQAAVWVPQGPLPPPQRPTKGPQAAKSQVESMPGGGGQSLAPLEVTVPVCLVEETSVFGSPLGTTRQALLPQGVSPARRGCPEATCTRRSRCGWEHNSPHRALQRPLRLQHRASSAALAPHRGHLDAIGHPQQASLG